MRKKTQYIVVNEIYKTIYCGYPQKRAWNVFEMERQESEAPHIKTIMDTSAANRLYMKTIYEHDIKKCPEFAPRLKRERNFL